MSRSRSARRQKETPAATATRARVAATSPRVTWIEELVTPRALSAAGGREHRIDAGGQVHPLAGSGHERARLRGSSLARRGRQLRRDRDRPPVGPPKLELAGRAAPNRVAALVEQAVMVAAEQDEILEPRLPAHRP